MLQIHQNQHLSSVNQLTESKIQPQHPPAIR
jgi:hypothetical protein